MTFRSFLWEAICRSCNRAWELGHFVHVLIIFGTGAFVVAGIHFEERVLIASPFLALLAAFLVGVFWFTYVIYRDEHCRLNKENGKLAEKIVELERTVQAYRTPKAVILDEVEPGVWKKHFRIKVKNESDSTAEHVGVQLFQTDPFVPHLPVMLHCCHLTRPSSDEVSLNPGIVRTFDVFRIDAHGPGLLDIAGAGMEEGIPLQKLSIDAQNSRSRFRSSG